MTDPAPDPRTGRSLLFGAALVAAFSLVWALARLHVHREALRTASLDPAARAMAGPTLGAIFVQNLLQGPVLWIVGSGLLYCGLAVLQRPRGFRPVLAATGVPFLAPVLSTAVAYGLIRSNVPLWGIQDDRLVIMAMLVGLAIALGWVVANLRRLGVEVARGALASLFAAVLFALGKWLPTLLA